jgi:NADPH-dependent 7-cyano-7-deazaguanine reductase QueF
MMMSKSIEVPAKVLSYLDTTLNNMPFEKLLTLFLKGACRHTGIPNTGELNLELEAVKLECIALNTYKFTFRIIHECPDDRTHYVVDKTIEVLSVAARLWGFIGGDRL